ISISLSELPLPGGILARIPPGGVAGAGVFVGLAALAAYVGRSRRRVEPAPEAIDDGILDRALQLDVDLREGRITEADYQAAQTQLIAGARRASQENPGPSSAS